jgi:hypothetical protein
LHGNMLSARSGKWEVGSWEREVGSWELEVGSGELGVGRFLEVY